MTITQNIANHLRGVYFGENWTESCLQEHMKDLTWEEATSKIEGCNTILSLVYHMNYYVYNVANFLQGKELKSSDKLSFDHPTINSKNEWIEFLNSVWSDGKRFTSLIEKLPDDKLTEIFNEEKYGNYFKNLMGITEHIYYHLGQIVILKKIIRNEKK